MFVSLQETPIVNTQNTGINATNTFCSNCHLPWCCNVFLL